MMKFIKLYENFLSALGGRTDNNELNTEEFFQKYVGKYITYFKNFFDADFTQKDSDRLIEILEDKCGEFLNELRNKKQYPIFRGADKVPDTDDAGVYYKSSYQNRKSLDTSDDITDIFDSFFLDKFGTKIRSVGIFTTKVNEISTSYGKSYIFFPFDGYRYFWSPNITDFYQCTHAEHWYQIFTNMSNEYDEKYSEPWSNSHEGSGKWVSFDGKEFSTFDDAKSNDLERNDVKWVPNISFEDFEADGIEDAKDNIFNIVEKYEEGGIENVRRQEMIFLTKNYLLIETAFFPKLMEYLGLNKNVDK